MQRPNRTVRIVFAQWHIQRWNDIASGDYLSIFDRWIRQLSRPLPIRTRLVRDLLRVVKIGSFEARLRAGVPRRPYYAMCLYYAALQAKRLGYSAMTAVELGVAGGNGLLCMSDHADAIQKELGVEVVVVGFDAGSGLPESSDSRDLKYYWSAGAFPMDCQALQARIAGKAELVIGNVADTCQEWNPEPNAPLGMIAFDLDLFSSTMAAFSHLEKRNVLPRIWCYFDDIADFPQSCLTDFLGVAAAIKDFNEMPQRKLLRDNLSQARVFAECPIEWWHSKIYIYHRLSHPQYDIPIYNRAGADQLALE
jgi:hypothetical protein